MSEQKLYFQCLFGIQCRNFVMIAADRMDTESFLVMKDDVDKLYELSNNIVLGVNGDSGEMAQLTEFIAKNLKLYKMRNKYELSVPAVAHFTRKSLTDVLRTGTPYTLNLMLAGYDEKTGAHLYTMDTLAACMKVPYATHGLGGILTLGIMDQYYKPGLTEPEAYEVLKMCIREVQLRLLMNLPHFKVKTVSRHGVLTLPDINSTMLLQK